jgi:hypothetical protein
MPGRAVFAGALLALASVAGCGDTRQNASEVRVVADDYNFRAPDRLEEGPTTFVVENVGAEGHDFILGRMLEDVEVPELVEIPQTERDSLFQQIAKTLIIESGDTSRVTADLTPGSYAYLCLAQTEAGRSHAYQGMWGEFRVV